MNIYWMFNEYVKDKNYMDRLILNENRFENPAYFIDSILRNLPTQSLYLDGNNFEVGVIDGNKRLNAVKDFRNNNFPLIVDFFGKKTNGLYYNDLIKSQFPVISAFERYSFQANVLNPGMTLIDREELLKRLRL